jgi:small subunit ribosomal protein S7
MWDGKKSTAFKVFYDAIDIIEAKSKMQKTIIRHLEML